MWYQYNTKFCAGSVTDISVGSGIEIQIPGLSVIFTFTLTPESASSQPTMD